MTKLEKELIITTVSKVDKLIYMLYVGTAEFNITVYKEITNYLVFIQAEINKIELK